MSLVTCDSVVQLPTHMWLTEPIQPRCLACVIRRDGKERHG
jgi:hypothetical protein